MTEKVNRRGFLRWGTCLGFALPLGGIGAYLHARHIEARWLEVVHQDLELTGLPEAFAGFTIAQISDLHLGPFLCLENLEPVVQAICNLRPDAIVLTGDFVTRLDHGEPEMLVQALSRLTASEGVFAVLGNHDWWGNGPLVSDSLRKSGVTLLVNRHISWRRGSQELYLAGIDDVWVGRHDLAEAMAGIPVSARAILLAHEPDFADAAALDPRILVQLSGHTHGGQICCPILGPLHLPPYGRHYPRGLYTIKDMVLYTNRGIGMVFKPLRFACRPEVTLFTLRPASS